MSQSMHIPMAASVSSFSLNSSESSLASTVRPRLSLDYTPATPPPTPTLFQPPLTTIQATAGVPFHGRIPLVCTRAPCYVHLWDVWHRGVIIAWSPSSEAYLVYVTPSTHIIAIAGAFIRVDPIDLPFPCNLTDSSPFLDIWPHSLRMSYSAPFHRSDIISPPHMEPLDWDDDQPWASPSPERYVIPASYAERTYRTQPVDSGQLALHFSEVPTKAQLIHLQTAIAARLLEQQQDNDPRVSPQHPHTTSNLRSRLWSNTSLVLRSLPSLVLACLPKF